MKCILHFYYEVSSFYSHLVCQSDLYVTHRLKKYNNGADYHDGCCMCTHFITHLINTILKCVSL